MAYKEVSRVDIVEVIRRWQKGNSQRHIASGTRLSRDTVRKYLAAAEEVGVSREGPDPSEEQLSRLAALSRSGPRKKVTPAEDMLQPLGDQIYRWITVDRLQVTRIGELLSQRGCQVSYTSLRRFLQRRNWRHRSARTVRMEQSGPGEVAELDFGRLGFIQDQEAGRRRTVWALIVALALQAQLPVAHLQPEAGGGDRRPGPSSAASPSIWSLTTSPLRRQALTHCTPA